MDPVVTNSASNTCADPINSNCVQITTPVPGTSGLCYPATLTQVITSLGNTIVGNQSITGLDFGCLYNPTVGVCPTGWTFVPANGSIAAHCSNGCPAGSVPSGSACVACGPFAPCPPPLPTYIPNPVPPPTTLIGILQLMINVIPCCDPCTTSANSSPNPGP